MSKAVKLCSVILSLVLLFSCVLIKAQTQTAYINGTGVNIRAEASTSSKSLKQVTNDYVTVLEKIENSSMYPWYKIRYGSIEGYIYGDPEWFVLYNPTPDTPINPDANKTFEESLADFPESYHSYLRSLHEKYPNWIFVADKLTMSFEEAVQNEFTVTLHYDREGKPVYTARSMVELSQGIAWRSLHRYAYDWQENSWRIFDSNRWVASSKEVVAYYMDPRNFLDSTYVYMFLKQSYNPQMQTEEGLKAIIKNTFLDTTYTYDATNEIDKKYEGSYLKVLMAAAEISGVSPYVLASKILAEIGSQNPSAIVSGTYPGYEGYYNFYNWGAFGDNPVLAGLIRAKSEGWDSRASAIIGGAKELADGYVNDKQDTYYYMDFNVVKPPYYSHQYAAAAYDARNKAYNLSKTYQAYASAPLVFSIPVYTSIPDAVSTKAETGDQRYNNYYLTALTADNLSPQFEMYTQNYSMNISGDTTIYVKTPDAASVISASSYNLIPGTNTVKITVKAQSGFTNDYILTVIADKPCKFNVVVGDKPTTPPDDSGDNPTPEPPPVIKGDANNDGIVDEVDLAAVRLFMLNKISFTADMTIRADINQDAIIDEIDLAGIRLFLLGKLTLA